jgi:hypothetical protein
MMKQGRNIVGNCLSRLKACEKEDLTPMKGISTKKKTGTAGPRAAAKQSNPLEPRTTLQMVMAEESSNSTFPAAEHIKEREEYRSELVKQPSDKEVEEYRNELAALSHSKRNRGRTHTQHTEEISVILAPPCSTEEEGASGSANHLSSIVIHGAHRNRLSCPSVQ